MSPRPPVQALSYFGYHQKLRFSLRSSFQFCKRSRWFTKLVPVYFTEKTDIKQGLRFWLGIGGFAAKKRFNLGGDGSYDPAGESGTADTTSATTTSSGHFGDRS